MNQCQLMGADDSQEGGDSAGLNGGDGNDE